MMRKGAFPSARPSGPALPTERLSGQVSWFSTTKGFGFVKPTDGTEDVFLHVSVVQRAGMDSLREGTTVACEVAPGKKGRQVMRLLEVDESTAVEGSSGGDRERAPRGDFGDRGGYGQDRGGFGDRGGYGQDRGGYDRGGYGQDRGGYGQDRGGYGQDRGGYGQDRGGYGERSYGNDRGDRGGNDYSGPTESGEGIVKWFNATKGFGFITPDSGGKDVFLHASVLRRAGLVEVQPGQRVRFTSIERDKGPEARSLEVDGNGGGGGGGY
ncbi:cold-shock protein [Lacibacterium aquatile]|uniref:Cold-shock protein n=1 Tax=Lacibacterium aquatile TaxID=1168082 RepID=A0ABW5DPV0_9PROT